MRADPGRAIAMAAGGAIAFAPIEYALTLWAHSGSTPIASKLRLVALVGTLSLYLFFILATALAAAAIAARLAATRIDPARATSPGLLAHAPVEGGVRPGVPKLWAAVATGLVVLIVVQRAGAWAMVRFKEPQLTAALIAAVALAAAGLAYPLYRALALPLRVGAEALGFLAFANPLGRWRAAGLAF